MLFMSNIVLKLLKIVGGVRSMQESSPCMTPDIIICFVKIIQKRLRKLIE